MLVMENELLKRDMKDMEDRFKAEIAGALQASREETKAELKAQIAGLMDILAQGQGNGQNNNGQNNNGNGNNGQGNGAAEMMWTGGETGECRDAGASEP